MEETYQNIECTRDERRKLEEIASSVTAGIWRIKRAKIILGTLEGRSVDRLVLDTRVMATSIIKCRKLFMAERLRYFKTHRRKPTPREERMERMLAFLENPPPPGSPLWRKTTVHCIGRDYSAREIKIIRDFINAHPEASIAEIVSALCEQLGLRQANGTLRKAAFRDTLFRLTMDNIISAPFSSKKKVGRRKAPRRVIKKPAKAIKLDPGEIPHLQIVLTKTTEELEVWSDLFYRHHYIKSIHMFGPTLRYLVFGGKTPVMDARLEAENRFKGKDSMLLGGLSFGPGAWRLADRDKYIGWSDRERTANLRYIVNNVRFLILPWIKSPNLASRILGAIVKQVPHDWEKRYNYRPALLETFVETERFRGTSYRAANWLEIGKTKGRHIFGRKVDKYETVKTIFLYPLHRNYRRILLQGS